MRCYVEHHLRYDRQHGESDKLYEELYGIFVVLCDGLHGKRMGEMKCDIESGGHVFFKFVLLGLVFFYFVSICFYLFLSFLFLFRLFLYFVACPSIVLKSLCPNRRW